MAAIDCALVLLSVQSRTIAKACMRTSATTKAPTSTTAAYPRLPKTYFFSNPPLMYTTANYYYQCRTVDPPVGALDGPAWFIG